MPHQIFLQGPNLIIETIFAAIIVISCLIIYFKTKEIYDLTSHKGLKYFRKTFLFLGIAFFIRFFIRFFLMSFHIHPGMFLPPQTLSPLITILFIYITTIAALYLVYSVSWKKLEKTQLRKEYTIHILAILILLITFTTSTLSLLLLIQGALFIYALIIAYSKKNKKTLASFKTIYLLLFLFYILTLADLIVPNFFTTIQLVIYIISAALFVFIVYKVIQKISSVEKT